MPPRDHTSTDDTNTPHTHRAKVIAAATATGVALVALNLTFAAVAGAFSTGTATPPSTHPALDDTLQLTLGLRHQLPLTPAVFAAPTVSRAPRMALIPSVDGISSVALTAYQRAASGEQIRDSSCRIPWQLIASIGYIESDDGQFGGDTLSTSGQEAFPIDGIPLDGSNGIARIPDGHGGYARAQGPMQFIPSTWAVWGTDGNGDGRKDPQNIFDAAAAAARYLCAGTGDLSNLANQPSAITHYNDSPIYVKNVMAVEHAYVSGLSAATVVLIPMPTTAACPSPTKAAPAPTTPAPTASATPQPSSSKVCTPPSKKPTKPSKGATTKPSIVTHRTPPPTPAPKPSPTPSSTPTAGAVSPSPSPQPTPTSTPTASAGSPSPSP